MIEWIATTLCVCLLGAVALLVRRDVNSRGEREREKMDAVARINDEATRLKRDVGRGEEILDHMAEGVILLNEWLTPIGANEAARVSLGLFDEALPARLPADELVSVARRAFVHEGAIEEVINIWSPKRLTLRVRAAPLEDRTGIVLVLQDITEELRTQHIRREFVANASHELKSPVAGLQTLAEAVREAMRDDAESAARFAERIVFESERLGRLITDLLDLSRLEDPTNISTSRVDLSDVARRELAGAEHAARNKEMSLVADISPAVVVTGDDQQLGLMIKNLLDNAIRYTPSGGRVELDVHVEREDAVIRVSDTGIGIPLQAQGRVFERFYRVDQARSRETGGTGLGLAIVKHVAELHGGHIGLQSEIGEGSTFTVRLPAHKAEQSPSRSIAS